MKKFLTVLLVIAVMFTFSFGTAMAATDADAFSAAVAAYKSALTYTGDGYLTSAGVPTASDEWKDKVSKTILEAAIDAWADDADLTSSTAYLSGSNLNTTYLYTSAFVTSVEAAQYDAELAKLNDLIASIDLAAYNTTGKTALQSAIETAEDNVAALTGGKTIANAASVKGEVTTLKSAVSTNKANLLSEVSDDLAKTIAALETKLTHNLDHELDRFSKEIKDAIAQEILKRYYFQRGAILQRLKDDPDLKKAIETLNNQSEYSKILSVMK